MKNLISALALILTVNLFSCKNATKNENTPLAAEDSLYNEVMRVHDEMMPKMQDIVTLKGKLSTIADSLVKIDSTTVQPYSTAINNLSGADKAMMGWMHQFEPNMDGLTDEEKINYLNLQKNKMDSVKIVMQNAIDEGNKLLNSN